MYEFVGQFIFAFFLISLLLIIIALFFSKMSLLRSIWLAGFFARILDLFYMPIKYFFYKFSNPKILDEWMVSIKNIANKDAFIQTNNRIILAPHCMRALDCPAYSTKEGIQCISCGKCIFGKLKKDAHNYGYKLYIITGSSFVKHILNNNSIEGALLIACNYELNKVMRVFKGSNVITYGVSMLNDGCYNTQVDYNVLKDTFEDLKKK